MQGSVTAGTSGFRGAGAHDDYDDDDYDSNESDVIADESGLDGDLDALVESDNETAGTTSIKGSLKGSTKPYIRGVGYSAAPVLFGQGSWAYKGKGPHGDKGKKSGPGKGKGAGKTAPGEGKGKGKKDWEPPPAQFPGFQRQQKPRAKQPAKHFSHRSRQAVIQHNREHGGEKERDNEGRRIVRINTDEMPDMFFQVGCPHGFLCSSGAGHTAPPP